MSKSSLDWLWQELTPNDVKLYLLRNGWEQVAHPNESLVVFKSTPSANQERNTVVVPANTNLDDYHKRIAESVNIISELHHQPTELLLQRMVQKFIDSIKTRIGRTAFKAKTIPLELAANIIPAMRDFVGFAACSEDNPRPFFARATGVAKSFTEHCQFGHTFRGSFGLTIECPLPLPQEQTFSDLVQAIPFERRVMERIAKSYGAINAAEKADSTEPLVENYQTAMNANMCEKLAEAFTIVDGQDLDFSISWSQELKTNSFPEGIECSLKYKTYQYLISAAKELQKVDKSILTTVVGKISMLRSEEQSGQQSFERMINMNWEIERNTVVKIRVILTNEEYRQGCDAHKDGKRISVQGFPEKHGKYWYLINPNNFHVLPE